MLCYGLVIWVEKMGNGFLAKFYLFPVLLPDAADDDG